MVTTHKRTRDVILVIRRISWDTFLWMNLWKIDIFFAKKIAFLIMKNCHFNRCKKRSRIETAWSLFYYIIIIQEVKIQTGTYNKCIGTILWPYYLYCYIQMASFSGNLLGFFLAFQSWRRSWWCLKAKKKPKNLTTFIASLDLPWCSGIVLLHI